MAGAIERSKQPMFLFAVLAAVLWLPSGSSAQNLSSAGIDGTVTDQSGQVLPGVTVTATSPALQVGQLSTVSDAEGRYSFANLARGVYLVKFELSGFSTLVREGLQLNAGFTARVDVSMVVGGLSETVLVSGASPVVDVSSTRGGQTVNTDLLVVELPGNKTMARRWPSHRPPSGIVRCVTTDLVRRTDRSRASVLAFGRWAVRRLVRRSFLAIRKVRRAA